MKIALYLAKAKDGSTKGREEAIGAALKSGFERHGDSVDVYASHEYDEPRPGVQIAAVIGVKGHSKRIFDQHRRAGRHALLIDKSYFGRSEYMRLSLDGFQPHYAHAKPRPADRLNKLGVRFQAKRRRGQYVIYAGSSQKYCDWHELGDATEFAVSMCTTVNKVFGTGNELPSIMPVLYRPKPSWAAGHPEEVREVPGTKFSGPDVKLGELLGNCHALVTHGSNAAVEAVVAGVPAMVVSRGACAAEPVAETDIGKLWDPRFPTEDERRQWAANLAYCQFNLDEIASGFAWSTLQHLTIKPLEGKLAQMNEIDSVIEQYKIMHRSPKMFRGRLADVFGQEIAEIYKEMRCESWLDFGCGKGLQYKDAKVHEALGLPMPALYDPAVPGIDQKPQDRTFELVVCLDVMEHIPEAHVDETLREIFGFAKKCAYFVIFTDPARKSLPDGRNCHLTVKPESWWRERLEQAAAGKRYVAHFKGKDE